MACRQVNFTVSAMGQSITNRQSSKDWYNWFDNYYMKLTQAGKDYIYSQMKKAASRKCFDQKLARYTAQQSQNAAKCVPTSSETRAVENYKKTCVYNNVGLQTTLNKFYGATTDSIANYKYLFDTKRDNAQGEINEIETIIKSFPRALTDIDTQITNKKKEIDAIDEEIKLLEDKTSAYEQQFVDDKAKIGKTVDKKKLNVLQDYLLAAFFIGYLFFALVAIFYVTKINDYSWKIFGAMVILAVIIGGLMSAVVNYVG